LPLVWAKVRIPAFVTWEKGQEHDEDGIWESCKFVWVRAKEEISCDLDFPTKSRGVFELSQLQLISGDGIGLCVKQKMQPLRPPEAVVVFPVVKPVRTDYFQYEGIRMSRREAGGMEDVTLLKNIRKYEPTDSFKQINYRILAKQNEWYVNQYETIRPKSICMLLDFGSFWAQPEKIVTAPGEQLEVPRCHREELERAISLVASALTAFYEQQIHSALLLQGYASQPQVMADSTTSLEEKLTLLAQISYQGEECRWEAEKLLSLQAFYGQRYIVCYGSTTLPEAVTQYHLIDITNKEELDTIWIGDTKRQSV
jgi:uncharacterized protein (DUF58 family)